jgi:DNA-binding MarR family transcriptional regulator
MSRSDGEDIAKGGAVFDQEPSNSSSESDSRSGSLKSLADQLNDPALKSSARVVILISLSINQKLTFIELLELTGLGKGSLENHLDKLSDSQYIRKRNIKTFGGLRELVEITSKGQEVCRSLLTELRNVRQNGM